MRKFLRFLIPVLAITLCLTSCKQSDVEVPDGLQIVNISEEKGYQFFGPEEWVVANNGAIDTSYVAVSGKVMASISFTETDMPEGTLKDYFESQKPLFAYDITVKEEPKIAFGNANGESYSVIYTFNYDETDYACMQIFVKHSGSFYIFTYTAEGDPTSEDSYYQKYIEAVRLSVENFKFTEKSGTASTDDSGSNSDEYKLVSEKDVAGFELYLPGDYTVVSSDASVSAKISEKANIFISKATDTGINSFDYIKEKKNNILTFADKVTDIRVASKTQFDKNSEIFEGWSQVMTVEAVHDDSLVFGNLHTLVVCYEYTYEVNSVTYHVYQILGVNPGVLGTAMGAAGYVFTYTATEDEYANHIDEIQNILQRIKF